MFQSVLTALTFISAKFVSEVEELERVRQKIKAGGYEIENAEHVFIPKVRLRLFATSIIKHRI